MGCGQNHAKVKQNIEKLKREDVTSKNETKDVCFPALKWFVRFWKGFETETKKLEINEMNKENKYHSPKLMGLFGRANENKQLGEIKLFHRYQLCLFISLLYSRRVWSTD